MIERGDQLPDTHLNLRAHLTDGPLLVLFISEIDTPLCTAQLCAFRDDYEMVEELGAAIVAVSSDEASGQAEFRAAQQLPFPMLSDSDLSAATAFGVADLERKQARRAAFVADADGIVQLAILFYQPANLDHYQAVFEALGLDV